MAGRSVSPRWPRPRARRVGEAFAPLAARLEELLDDPEGRVSVVYTSCMATKTISIEVDVYERIKALRSMPSESFSEVLRRALPSRTGLTGGETLAMIEDGTYPVVGWTEAEIDAIENVDAHFHAGNHTRL